jgi:hypothetical protein
MEAAIEGLHRKAMRGPRGGRNEPARMTNAAMRDGQRPPWGGPHN